MNEQTQLNIAALLSHVPLFSGLDTGEVARIARGTREIHVNKGDILFHKGDSPTGFYLVVFGEVTSEEILPLVRELFEFVADFEGDVPGAAPEECGNYLDQNLPMANWLARRYLDRDLADIDEKHLHYQQA